MRQVNTWSVKVVRTQKPRLASAVYTYLLQVLNTESDIAVVEAVGCSMNLTLQTTGTLEATVGVSSLTLLVKFEPSHCRNVPRHGREPEMCTCILCFLKEAIHASRSSIESITRLSSVYHFSHTGNRCSPQPARFQRQRLRWYKILIHSLRYMFQPLKHMRP